MKTFLMVPALFVGACSFTGSGGGLVSSHLTGGDVFAERELPGISTIRPVAGWVDRELVAAPELFNASGVTQWNGRRTQRGIWAAHPKARGRTKVRMINARTGAEVDGTLYPLRDGVDSDLVTLSSDAAMVLGLEQGDTASISLVGLRPKGTQSPAERAQVKSRAQGDMVAHISQLGDAQLLKLLAASMRAMGYDTRIEDGPDADGEPSIRAVMAPVDGVEMPAVRVVVRPHGGAPMSASEAQEVADWIGGFGDLGVLVSLPGFGAWLADAPMARDPKMHLVDLDTLVHLWLVHYERMVPEDQALLPLEPVYFVASRAGADTRQP